jgi:bifunctional enzyme Fae/Hps
MLNKKKKYLQIALNSTIEDARDIISKIPLDERIIVEAGTPFIKNYGIHGIRTIKRLWEQRVLGVTIQSKQDTDLISLYKILREKKNQRTRIIDNQNQENKAIVPYIVADLKCMDRGLTEVEIAQQGGASAATALGYAPIETLDAFIEKCKELGLDSMIDMMNVGFPLNILRQLKQIPDVVILHRGVDEEDYNREKEIPYHEIQRIKSNYDIMLSVAGGDTIQEVQRAIFNDVDIVVLWRAFYKKSDQTVKLVQEFLKEVR